MTTSSENMHDQYFNSRHPDDLLNAEVTFETTDISVGSIVGLGVALLLTLFVSLLIVWATFRTMDAEQRANQTIISPLRIGMAPEFPPNPRLQGSPGNPVLGPQELSSVISQSRSQLDGSGWVNSATGVTHIPIQQAMEMIVQHGLPEVHPTSTATAIATATAAAGASATQYGAGHRTPKKSPHNSSPRGARP
jgi:hypothetical protein